MLSISPMQCYFFRYLFIFLQFGGTSRILKANPAKFCWKNSTLVLEKRKTRIFKEQLLETFGKSHNAEKLKKRPFRLIKRFYKLKTSKKCKGLPLDRIRKFSKKSRIVPKKLKKNQTKENLWSRIYFWKHKKSEIVG